MKYKEFMEILKRKEEIVRKCNDKIENRSFRKKNYFKDKNGTNNLLNFGEFIHLFFHLDLNHRRYNLCRCRFMCLQ